MRSICRPLLAKALAAVALPGSTQEAPGRRPQRTLVSRSAQPLPPHPGGPAGRGGRGFLALLNEPEPVSGADFDLDSRVTAVEWRRAADNRFDLLDDKHAGVLTRAALMTRFPTPRKAKR